MTIPEEDWLQISGIEHFAFCRRQWALVHLEDQWVENLYTVEGNLLHERAHDPLGGELRGSLLTVRALRVFSPTLGVTGTCDVVEFQRDPGGVPLRGRNGNWRPIPIEYKRDAPKQEVPVSLQLCCQAMCLEEILCCSIPQGAVFYGGIRRRVPVVFSQELRERVRDTVSQMHLCRASGRTPRGKPTKSCNACSLREVCLPRLGRAASVQAYLEERLGEVEECESC